MSVVRIREDLLCEEDFRISDSMQAAGLTGIVIDIQLGPESCHKNPDTRCSLFSKKLKLICTVAKYTTVIYLLGLTVMH